MKAGLLGAIGGLGQAMQTIGSSIMERREKALADAKRLAEYERQRADKKADTIETRNFEIDKLDALETRRDARETARLGARATERREDREFRVNDREDRQQFASAESAASRRAATERVQLSSRLSASNTRAAIILRDKLASDDIRGVTYGAPDAEGKSAVFAVRASDGKLIDLKQKLRRPVAKKDDTGDEPL